MPGQVDSDAAPLVASDLGDHVTPQQAVGDNAVNEHRRSALSDVEVAGRAGCGRGVVAVGFKRGDVNRRIPFSK
jgi:hypothetical protein